ncbi:hypothetical protein V425_05620 [Lactococcus lactis RTB018]|nr:hypothetical protein [Lactococcus lactis]OAZ16860.1 hypothetical protein V425_05620 [Lactococcus lactis RTB018]
MNLSYKQSVEISKKEKVNRWGEPVYGEKIIYNNIELEKRPIFQTVGGKREVKQKAILTIFEPQNSPVSKASEEWEGARVIDEDHNVFYVEGYEPKYDENNNLIKHQLNLLEGRC